jgi:hypothetical protein
LAGFGRRGHPPPASHSVSHKCLCRRAARRSLPWRLQACCHGAGHTTDIRDSSHVQTRPDQTSQAEPYAAIVDASMYLMDRLPYILFLQRLKALCCTNQASFPSATSLSVIMREACCGLPLLPRAPLHGPARHGLNSLNVNLSGDTRRRGDRVCGFSISGILIDVW